MKKKTVLTSVLMILIFSLGMVKVFRITGSIDTADSIQVGNALKAVSLLPTLAAIILAFVSHNVLLSLFLGLVIGAVMVTVLNTGSLMGFIPVICSGMVETMSDRENATVLLLCLSVGGLVEMVHLTGGFETLAEKLTARIDSAQKANVMSLLFGLMVFFDDYANTLIVGPLMRNITDRTGISREKLAFIIDATAAPVSGVVLISSWIGVELSVIEEGLLLAGSSLSAYEVYLASRPYMFYCLLLLLFVLIGSLMKREYGSMLTCEKEARRAERKENKVVGNGKRAGISAAVVPMGILLIYSLVRFCISGRQNCISKGLLLPSAGFSLSNLAIIFGNADAVSAILEATLVATVVTVIIGVVQKVFTISEAVEAFVKGCGHILETDMILVLAWTLSGYVEQLGAIHYTVGAITANVAWWLVPVMVFLACCLISSAVGSFGCMFIAMPMCIPSAVAIMHNSGLGMYYLYLVIGCVIAGGIVGDHLSPVTDCTILSCQGAECDKFQHVMTQLPYGLTVLAVSLAAGIIPATFGVSPLVSYGAATILFILLFKILGEDPQYDQDTRRKNDVSKKRFFNSK